MKNLFRIIRRYSLTVGLIIFIILAGNGCLLVGFLYYIAGQKGEERYLKISSEIMEEISKEFRGKAEACILSDKGMQMLEESEFVWAMALDKHGNTVWQWQLPEEIPTQYSIQDVAVFSRWYLCDYPVKVLTAKELLLVFGCDPNMVSRHSLLISLNFLKNLPLYIRLAIFFNLLVIVVFILCFGWRFYALMRPVAQGIEDLSAQKPVHLREKGLASELAEKLNETSQLLLAQNQTLARRDLARTEWIAGVSHDIRTPLYLIIGHSDRLSRDDSISRENRLLAKSIRRQSLIIRQLVADLNLTSKLAYQTQPLKKTRFPPASLVRSCVSDFYNEGLEQGQEEQYEFEIMMGEDMEQFQIEADQGLLMRALRNLLGNCIRHNPKGCRVTVRLTWEDGFLSCLVQDTGPGIPEKVVQHLADLDSPVHIMGLRLAEQIAKAHGGTLEFIKRPQGGYDAQIYIPVEGVQHLEISI